MTGKHLLRRGSLTPWKCPSWTNTLSIIKLARTERKLTKSGESQYQYNYETSKESTFPSSVSVGEDSDESDSGNDLVLCDESQSESESDDDSHTETIQEGTSTRSGRRVGHWSTRYADFVQWTGTPYRGIDWRGLGVDHLLCNVIWGWVKNQLMGLKGLVTFFFFHACWNKKNTPYPPT